MNRARSIIPAAGILLLMHRLYDCLFNINPATGFYDNNGDPIRLVVLGAAVAAVVICVNAVPEQRRPLALRPNIFAAALLAASGVLVLAGSAFLLLDHGQFTLPAARILGFAAGVVGLASAGWLCVCAFWFVRGRKTGFYTLLSFCLFPLWLCLRAVAVFSRAPVNANDSVTLAQLFCPVALAWCWLVILKALCADGKTDKLLYPAALTSILLSVCVGLPTALVCARAGDRAAVCFFLSDALCAAAAALFAASTRPQPKGAPVDVTPQ